MRYSGELTYGPCPPPLKPWWPEPGILPDYECVLAWSGQLDAWWRFSGVLGTFWLGAAVGFAALALVGRRLVTA